MVASDLEPIALTPPRKKTAVGQIFRESVLSITKSKHLAFGAHYRKLRGKRGAAVAVTAIARKLAALYYRLMTKGLAYVEEGVKRYEERYRKQQLHYLQKKAASLGYVLSAAA